MINQERFDSLQIKPSRGWWMRYYSQYYLGVMMSSWPIIAKILLRIGYELTFLGNLGKEHDANLVHRNILRGDDDHAQSTQFGSQFGYEDELNELAVAVKYHAQLKKPNFKNDISESAAVYEHAIRKLSSILDKGKVRGVVNFGVSYGYVDSILAKKYPHIEFIGIDRSKFTKQYNENHFAEIENLKFIAGDIFELLRSRKFDNCIFFHTRTCLLLPTNFISEVYNAAFSAGFSHVVGLEQIGISRETAKMFTFSEQKTQSVLFRGFMFIHNYPGILMESGYKLEEIELIKTNHPHEDLRILSFIAGK